MPLSPVQIRDIIAQDLVVKRLAEATDVQVDIWFGLLSLADKTNIINAIQSGNLITIGKLIRKQFQQSVFKPDAQAEAQIMIDNGSVDFVEFNRWKGDG